MYRIKVYGTGSSGNCMVINDGKTRIMVDAGLPSQKLSKLGLRFSEIDFLFISHDHGDHNKYAAEVSNKYEIPVIGSRGTIKNTPDLKERLISRVEKGKTYRIKSVLFVPFRIVHDAHEPLGFLIQNDMLEKLAFIPETGTLKNFNVDADYYVLEVNHSRKLIDIAYESEAIHETLYKRITSHLGHLSIEDALKYIDTKRSAKFLFHHMSSHYYDRSVKLPKNCELAVGGVTFCYGTEVPY
jgi:phosphoribosyl 1,2-cyclic phosphodiesterase